ncbi:hypothetical protein FIU87_14865 [Bacillus sp. THAF10]|nr:hypothetical protein [Bacillus sp. THAF10]QFT89944.1 hypothetical protein FIU87_14865 [Bacillus sp. THAF10]
MKKFVLTFLVVSLTLFGASAVTSHAAPSDDYKKNELPPLY